jgi:hypothetical protein
VDLEDQVVVVRVAAGSDLGSGVAAVVILQLPDDSFVQFPAVLELDDHGWTLTSTGVDAGDWSTLGVWHQR